jgi:hypothetical protein
MFLRGSPDFTWQSIEALAADEYSNYGILFKICTLA